MEERHQAISRMVEQWTDPIEIGGPEEEGEFDTSDYEWDAHSLHSVATFQSATSSVLKHEFGNGRRYHHYRYGRYPIPNDDVEQNREALKHAMTLELANGQLVFAPIDSPSRILDLGTGTGEWATEVGDAYPMAEVIGTDLSPIQPSWVPPNVRFIVDDVEDEWAVGSNFDLIHTRHLLPVLRNVEGLLGAIYTNLRPGGWVDIQEFGGNVCCDDDSLPPDSTLRQFFNACTESVKEYGMAFRVANALAEPLARLGFVNIRCHVHKTPIGPWPKDHTKRLVGRYMQIIMSDFVDVMGARPFAHLDMDDEQRHEFLSRAKEEIHNANYHSYINYYFISAQKPE